MVGAEAGLQERREYIEAREEEIAKLTATKMDLEDKMQVSTGGGGGSSREAAAAEDESSAKANN